MGLAHELAARIVALQYEDLSPAVLHWSKVAVLDTIGVTLAGAREPAATLIDAALELEAGQGPSLVFGTARRVAALDAAFINGTAAHALDFDNTSPNLVGHSSGPLLSALIAAAEAYGGDGRDVLLAHAAGFETVARLGPGVNLHHYEKGWHPTASLGVFGVAAACARLLRLSVDETATALAVCTSLASGIKANFGTMTKPLHAGHCARSGLLAVLLARRGYTANPEAFEHNLGFFNVFNGPGQYDASLILPGWGEPLMLESPGASYKQYPCCAGTDSAIEAALDLVREHGVFAPASIAHVETWTAARRLAHTNRPDPRTALEAKFSVQYCVARALLDGRVVFAHFEEEACHDPVVRGLMPRVRASACTERQFPRENQYGAEIAVTLTDGRVLEARVEQARGKSVAHPVAPGQLQAKFESCASRVLPADAVAAVMQAVDAFETLPSLRDFTRLLECRDLARGKAAEPTAGSVS